MPNFETNNIIKFRKLISFQLYHDLSFWQNIIGNILFVTLIFLFSGCAFKSVTFYEPCFDHNITLHLKKNEPIYIIRYDNTATSKYSRLETDTAHVISTSNHYPEKGWKFEKIGYTGRGHGFILTGRYAFAESRMMMAWHVGDSGFLEGYVGKHRVWIPLYYIDVHDVIDEDRAEIEYILSSTKSAKDGFWIASEFECPTGTWPEFLPLINALD